MTDCVSIIVCASSQAFLLALNCCFVFSETFMLGAPVF